MYVMSKIETFRNQFSSIDKSQVLSDEMMGEIDGGACKESCKHSCSPGNSQEVVIRPCESATTLE
jgi:hypothetical protein